MTPPELERKPTRSSRRKSCFFDANKITPSFADLGILRKFLSERGKILPSDKTGVCTKHQRELSKIIKQARQLGLLPYTDR